jgi:E3 ubiquitin-protein ligase RNF115/126
MEQIYNYWCFVCKKECFVEDKGDSVACYVCGSDFVEEIDKEDDPKNFLPNIKQESTQRIISVNNNNPTQNSSLGMFSFSMSRGPNGEMQVSSNFNNSNLTSWFDRFQSLFNFRPNFINLNSNPNTEGLLGFLNRHNNDQPFENLLNFLMQNDPNRHGNPPASKATVDNLPSEKITQDNIEQYNENTCLICMDSYFIDNTVVKLDCSHYFHDLCILDWLKIHNTCPVCRYELKTDDSDYENRKKERRSQLRNFPDSSN